MGVYEGLGRLWHGLDADRRVLLGQLVRYGVTGVAITLFYIGIYNLISGPAHWPPLIANTIAQIVSMLIGYTVHSRFSFAGHGSRDNVARTGGRFIIAQAIGFTINSLWVWSFTSLLHWPHWTPSLPMFFFTPFALFWLNRRWVFE
jgi:putative flippase GtrA